MKKIALPPKAFTIFTVLVVMLVWYFCTKFKLVSEVMVPSPKGVWEAFIDILKNDYKNIPLFEHLFVSLRRLLIAFIIAIVFAVPLGLISGYNKYVQAIFDPIIEFVRPLPPLAYYTLIVLWLGIADRSKIALLALAAFAPIYIACCSAMQRIKKDYVDSALVVGASKRQVFFFVGIPACLPEMFVGIRTAFGVAYTTLVSAEMVAAVSGIGWLVLDASRYLRSDIIFMGILIMGITGMLLDAVLRVIENKIVFWKGYE